MNTDKNTPIMLPPEIEERLQNKGILKDDIKFFTRCDMGLSLEFCDTFIAVTNDEVAVLETLGGIFVNKKKRFLGIGKTDTDIKEREFRAYSLSDYHDFRVEELLSGGRVVAVGDKGDEVIFNFSNDTKDNAFDAVTVANGGEIKKKEVPDMEDAPPMVPHGRGPGGPFGPPPASGKKIKELGVGRLLKKTVPFISKYKWDTVVILVMVVLSAGLALITPLVSGRFFYDEVLDEGGKYYKEILLAIMIIAGTKLLSVVFAMVHSMVTAKVCARVIYDVKKTIFEAIQKLSLSFFSSRQTGGLMTQINQDSNSIYWFFVDGLPYFITNIIQFVAIIIILFTMNVQLTLVTLIPVPLFILSRRAMFRHMKKLHARDYSKRRSFNAYVSDILTGSRVVKAFANEDLEQNKFDTKNKATADTSLTTSVNAHWLANSIGFVLEMGTYLAWGIGGYLVYKNNVFGEGAFTYGILVSYIAMLAMAYEPLDFFNRFSNQFTECMNAMFRLFEILDKKPDVVDKENTVIPENKTGVVEFKNVSFEYIKNRRVINNVSFKVEGGETIGIVGHTGAGKSTIVNLIMRLYDVTSGEILIDGVNVKDMPQRYIRDNIAIVSQETYVFRGSIADNIRYAKPDATDEEIICAAKAAGAHDFICKFADGYETQIGFGNKSLSGGELQRVSIARAILKNPRILILDEATAAMDTATEQKIQKAITEITKDKTTIIIAHRLSTLRDANRLIVIEDGKMTEAGTHRELIAKKGDYYRLYKMQLDALKLIGVEE